MNYREQAVEGLVEWVAQHGKPTDTIRADNAREFRFFNSRWRRWGRQNHVAMRFNAAGEPEGSGKIERTNQTLQDAMVTNTIGVDPRLWSFAIKAASFVWNRLEGRHRKSPYEMRYGRP